MVRKRNGKQWQFILTVVVRNKVKRSSLTVVKNGHHKMFRLFKDGYKCQNNRADKQMMITLIV